MTTSIAYWLNHMHLYFTWTVEVPVVFTSCSSSELAVVVSLYRDHVIIGHVLAVMIFFIANIHHLWTSHIVGHILPSYLLLLVRRSTNIHLPSFCFSLLARKDDEQCLLGAIASLSNLTMLLNHSRNIETIVIRIE